MKILTMDIGYGTQDILLFDSEKKSYENMNKIVVDSPTQRFARQIIQLSKKYQNRFIYGYILGGGPIVSAIKEVIKQGRRVIMTETAARTIKDNLDVAKKIGVEIVSDNEKEDYLNKPNFASIEIKEVDRLQLEKVFSAFNIEINNLDAIAVAVQDHGVPEKKMAQREFRFKIYKEMIDAGGKPENFAYKFSEVPSYFHRMLSLRDNIRDEFGELKGVIMDTSPATLFGILYDDFIEFPDVYVGVNVGNGHTLAGIFKDKKLVAIFEDHTVNITTERLDKLLLKFVAGNLTFEEIFENGGHGTYYKEKISEKIDSFFGIGPNRHILKKSKLNFIFPAPIGDVMMAGPITLANVAKNVLKL
ncbi:MAG: DUF1786 family protein [Candidatus Asgardarchaeia archaeon]